MTENAMRKLCLAAMSAAVVMWSLAGCKHEVAAGSRGTAPPDPLTVHLTPELHNEIKTGSAQWQEVTTQQKVAARVETDASRVARVGSPVNGRITKMLVFEGQHVRQGQVLAMLHSNALSDAQFAFIRAYTQENLARQSAARAKQLVQSDVIGTAELEKRQAELQQTSAEVAALGAQLRGLGMTEAAISRLETSRQINSEYPITASISGTLIERKVTIGQVVQPADEVFLIADLSNVWLVAEVPEEHSASLYPGKTVLATVPALPHEPVTGTLNFVSPVVNPETRTVQARMDLPNPKELFKPQMLASMTFESRPQRGLTIPSTAVVREDNKDQVFVKAGADSWRLREVELGPEVADHRLVLKGISDTDEIVLDGAFHLNNQRKQDMIKGAE